MLQHLSLVLWMLLSMNLIKYEVHSPFFAIIKKNVLLGNFKDTTTPLLHLVVLNNFLIYYIAAAQGLKYVNKKVQVVTVSILQNC